LTFSSAYRTIISCILPPQGAYRDCLRAWHIRPLGYSRVEALAAPVTEVTPLPDDRCGVPSAGRRVVCGGRSHGGESAARTRRIYCSVRPRLGLNLGVRGGARCGPWRGTPAKRMLVRAGMTQKTMARSPSPSTRTLRLSRLQSHSTRVMARLMGVGRGSRPLASAGVWLTPTLAKLLHLRDHLDTRGTNPRILLPPLKRQLQVEGQSF
jgi:hypothetical protein